MKTAMIVACVLVCVPHLAAGSLVPRAVFPKQTGVRVRDCDRWDLVVLKLVEGSSVRLRNGSFTAQEADLTELGQVISSSRGLRLARLFSRPEDVYDREKATGEAATGRQLADLNLYYALGPRSREEADRLLDQLNSLDIVECAYAEPRAVVPWQPIPAPLLPPSYVDSQDYLEDSPIGVNAYAAWQEPGGRGENVRMIDVELGWNWNHQDLPEPFFQGGDPVANDNHGTAVLGEIAGLGNTFGVTGISPLVQVGGVSIEYNDWPENVASWFDMASAALDPGDVWLIELHGPGPDGNYVCMEYWQGNYDAIAASTALGRICVEAGGNGSANLDNPIYEGRFDRNQRDSLAILVGAGTPHAMEPEWFTNYGSRIDANGWGSEIYSTGYGDLYSADGIDLYYTAEFGGTSGASPMLVGVCCVAQSIYKELTSGEVLAPEDLRAAITETGAPQPPPVTQYIGPRPDLAALLEHDIFDVEGVRFTADIYNCQAWAEMIVLDEGATGAVVVQVSSTTEPASESVTLGEVAPGRFTGAVQLSDALPQPGDGIVAVTHGDTIDALYQALADTDAVVADCIAPLIASVAVRDVGAFTAVIGWTTDEPASSIVHYGIGVPDQVVETMNLTTDHEVRIEDLAECTNYLFSVESADEAGNVTEDDNGGLYFLFETWELVVYLDENMDSDPEWTISGGAWAWGQPTGSGGYYGSPDPTSGYTGANVYGYNLAGDYTNGMPVYSLTTPAFDCSVAGQVTLSFQRWLGVESSSWDHARLKVSSDGGASWQQVWQNGETSMNGGAWELVEYDISGQAAGSPSVSVRWEMGDTDSSVVYCGWNIDDVLVACSQPCAGTPTPSPTATVTATPTASPEPTVTATWTPPASTPTPLCPELGVRLTMPSHHFSPGQPCGLLVDVCNPGPLSITDLPLFVILDIYGAYWFAPDWEPSPAFIGMELTVGVTTFQPINPFSWPDGAGSAEGIIFWGAMTDPAVTTVMGEYDQWEFGWSD
ncbi:S8 family serine peptidase [bacterium]|nr:S8 family serine peptidase [candidate division CSSED10-310 bacterium]